MLFWYRPQRSATAIFLLPFSWLFGAIVWFRRFCYRINLKKSYRFPVPIIVVGNLSVGGTGKTPFVLWLVHLLKRNGFKPGIVSRGVGGQKQQYPRWVSATDNPSEVGDEAVMLAKRSDCPLVICIDRVAAVRTLLQKSGCDIIVSDDGLQHYALHRDIEIVVIDGERGLGNQCLLPAGPLRELPSRLKKVNFIVRQGGSALPTEFTMQLQGEEAVSLINEQLKKPLTDFSNQRIHAVAAIGNPKRFFDSLKKYHLNIIEHSFPDHYLFKKEDLHFDDDLPILMTEKDAVKCKTFALSNYWYVPVDAEIESHLSSALLAKLS